MTSIPQHYLLIDGNPTVRRLAQVAFAQLQPEGTLTCVSSGPEALELLECGFSLPDVILLDASLPGMTGFQMLERLGDHPELHFVPVVMLTTPTTGTGATHAYSLHADSSLVMSKSFEAFMAQVELVLGYWQAIRMAFPQAIGQTRAAPIP